MAVCFSRLCNFKSWTGSCKGKQSFRTASPTCTTSRSWSQVLFLLCPHSWHEEVKHLGLLPSAADAIPFHAHMKNTKVGRFDTAWPSWNRDFRHCLACLLLSWTPNHPVLLLFEWHGLLLSRCNTSKQEHDMPWRGCKSQTGTTRCVFQWQTCHVIRFVSRFTRPLHCSCRNVELLRCHLLYSVKLRSCLRTIIHSSCTWSAPYTDSALRMPPLYSFRCISILRLCFVRFVIYAATVLVVLKILPLNYLRSSPCRLVRTYTSWRSMLVVASRILDCWCIIYIYILLTRKI